MTDAMTEQRTRNRLLSLRERQEIDRREAARIARRGRYPSQMREIRAIESRIASTADEIAALEKELGE